MMKNSEMLGAKSERRLFRVKSEDENDMRRGKENEMRFDKYFHQFYMMEMG